MGRILLAAWFVAMIVVGAGLLAKHAVALPTPHSPLLEPAMNALRTPEQRARWVAVHVLYSGCRCSQRVADHLATSQRPGDWSEIVLWVGDDATPSNLAARFDVRRVTAEELAAFGIEAAPSMVVVAPGGDVVYAGGYTDRKQGPVIEDRRILDEAHQGRTPSSLPVFGCAVSNRLQQNFRNLPAP